MENKVVIGIVSKHKKEGSRQVDSRIRDKVKQAIFDNGAIPIGLFDSKEEIQSIKNDEWKDILNKKEKSDLINQIQLCDGIILQGGTESDNYECIIAKYAYDNNIPILGICAGQNNIVRALGGTTYKIPNPEKHNINSYEYVHNIKINKDSKFYDLVKTKIMKVNSVHKRTIKDCPHLNKVAFCEDGYPDVVESSQKDFYIGVRFHPENLYKIDQNMNNIFKGLINTCKIKKAI